MSSVEKESFLGSCVAWEGIGIAEVILVDGWVLGLEAVVEIVREGLSRSTSDTGGL